MVSDYPTSTSFLRVDGWSMDPRVFWVSQLLPVLIRLFLLCRTLSNGFWRSFNFQGHVQFHDCQIHHEIFNSLLVITPIKFRDGKELRKSQRWRINKRAM